ncbi:MAG: 2Fe-2S iron-sulfur cluster-binding protein [Myxococcota bacterium]
MSEPDISGAADGAGPWHPLTVARVVDETADARSIVVEIPDPLREAFAYKAGQFLTFRVEVGGERLIRCYSLASSPDTDGEHKVTVKRIPDGRVSNWMNDAVRPGDRLEVMKPAGLFCLEDRSANIVLFGAGSGITPCISIVKTALARTNRRVKLVYANRDSDSIIFAAELAELAARHPDRFEVIHRLDSEHGFLDMDGTRDYIGDDLGADFYICGPGPFMDVVEGTIHALGIDRHQIFIERFESPSQAVDDAHDPAPTNVTADGELPEKVTVRLDGKSHTLEVEQGKTILQMVKAAGLEPPFACEEGYCGCCVATLKHGTVHMKTNDCLDEGELARHQVLTCQSLPTSREVEVEYPD